MSTVKVDSISGSHSPLATIEGLNKKQTIVATSGQTVFNLTQFDSSYDVIVYRGAIQVFGEWISNTQVQISNPATNGQLVHFYRSNQRAKSIKYEVSVGDYQPLQNLIDGQPNQTNTVKGLVRMANKTEVSNSAPLAGVAMNSGAAGLITPVGGIILWPLVSTPEGFLELNGQEISRTTYSILFALLGVSYGAGNGSTTFNLPDYRGEFVRGWDNSRGVDIGRVIGSNQTQDIQSHTHILAIGGDPNNVRAVNASASVTSSNSGISPNGPNQIYAAGGVETRPRNVAAKYIIRHGSTIA